MFNKRVLTAALCATMTGTVMADSFELEGVVRDLRRGDQENGHPDFETAGAMSAFGHVTGLVDRQLGDDGKPVYNADRPDRDTIYSADSLHQWFNDVPGVNVSEPLTLTVDNNQEGPGGVYSFSSNSFFPLDGRLQGNQGLSHNYHFTFELHTQFSYVPGQRFTFIGDDDVWVYVDGIQVIDLGGVHSAVTGSVLLFDGKAFVSKHEFALGGMVQEVTQAMADEYAVAWENLGLEGSSPVSAGDRYVDLNLSNGVPDTRVEFGGKSATVWSAVPIQQIDVRFSDGSTETFDGLGAAVTSTTVAGTGTNANKSVLGVWVQSQENADPAYFDVGGHGFNERSLDFFFAERHQTQSNFRIDTNMILQPVPIATISPLYD